jgi:hypothetical protein
MKQKVFFFLLSLISFFAIFWIYPVGLQAQSSSAEGGEYIPSPYDTPPRTFPIMRPDIATIQKWHDRHQRQPREFIDERFHRPHYGVNGVSFASPSTASGVTSASLLGNLPYNPSANQGSCGNCFAWAAHRVLGVDLKRQKSKAAELSVQYFNSCDTSYNCCGGWLSDVSDFYAGKLKAIPISNTGASWQDGSTSCSYFGLRTAKSCSGISTSTNYGISSITATTITTSGSSVSQATAIANIKNVINQGKAVWFAYYLPTSSAWNSFNTFWSNSSETTLWNSDNYCGQSWSSYGGGGHAVTIVGYDDSDADKSKHYWIVLNSWGTNSKRPKGLFRQKMYVNYNCKFSGLDAYALNFQTLKVSWK